MRRTLTTKKPLRDQPSWWPTRKVTAATAGAAAAAAAVGVAVWAGAGQPPPGLEAALATVGAFAFGWTFREHA